MEKSLERWCNRIEVSQLGATPRTDTGLEDRPDPFDRLAAERNHDLGRV